MAARLGEILVKAGACSDDAIRVALENQVVFGGRLGTNLLELEAVSEEALARALAAQHQLPFVHGPQHPDPAALALVPPELAGRHDVVPLLVRGRRLALAVADPRNLAMLDEVAFATGKAIHPVVAPEARVWALLRDAYGVDPHHRAVDVDVPRPPQDARAPGGALRDRRPEPQEDLMDERAFDALYAGVARSAPPAPAPAPGRAPPAAPAPPPPGPPDEVIELTELVEAEPWVVSADAAHRVAPDAIAEILAALDRAPGHAPPARIAPPAAPPPDPEPAPLSFAEAARALEGALARDAIARTVLRYARSKFLRAVLLTVHRGGVHGWVGLGERLGPDAVRRIHLALGRPGILDTVVRARAHFLGPIPRTEANIRLLKALGGGVPGNALLLPILAAGRVVNLLYVDNGRGGTVESGDVGELLILATRIAESYAALLARVR